MEESQVPKELFIHLFSKIYKHCVHVIIPGSLKINDGSKLNAYEF